MILSINYRLRCYRGLVNMYHDFFAHEIIGTSSVLFSKKIFNGCRDYVNMVPGKVTLATGQC